MKTLAKIAAGALVVTVAGPLALLFTPHAYAPGTNGCPPCYFDRTTSTLHGTMSADYVDHPYPFTHMALKLETAATYELHSDLPPSSMQGNTNITQEIDTDLTTIVKATLEWKCSHSPSHIVTQEIPLE